MAAPNTFLNNYGTGNSFLNSQAAAIKNGASGNSLVSQLFAGKPAPVVAGASNVKSPNAPATPGYTPLPANAFGTPSPTVSTPPTTPPPVHTPAPTTQPIASHTTTDGAGNKTTIKYVPPTDTTPTFGGIVGNLATQSGSQPNQNANAATAGLLNAPAQNAALGQQIQSNNAQYAPEIAAITKGMVGQETGDATTGTAPVGEGNAAVAAAAGGQELQGLSQAEQANLASTGQQLTAQGQGQSALTSAGGVANTQQANAQSGLTSAGQLSQPVLGSIGAVPYSPTTGTQGAVLGSTQPGGVAAAGNLLGQLQGATAAGAAPGQANAQNTITGGTATTAANNTIFQTAKTQGAAYSTAQNNINTLGNSILSMMTSTPGINSTDSRFLNTKLNDIQSQFNSPAYANFNAQISALQRAVSQYLQNGEIPTTATKSAGSIADGSATIGALAGALKGIDSDLDAAVQAQQTTADYAQSQMTQGNSNTGGGFDDASFYGK